MTDPDPSPPAAADPLPAAPVERRTLTLAEALQLGQELQRGGRLEPAEQVYLQVLQASPSQPDALNFLGVLRFQQGRTDEALALLVHAVQAAGDQPDPWLNLANVLIEAGHHDDAVKALRQVVALAPDSVLARNNLGVLHLRRGEHAAAEAALKEALAIGGDHAYLHHNLARLYFNQGRLRECAAHSLLSSRLDPTDPQAPMLRARALSLLGEHDAALQLLREWVEREPDDAEARHALAAAGGAEVPPQASADYVEALFDRFAESFDAQLESLGYRAPDLVAERLARHRQGQAPGVLLDAGCGTGLAAAALRPLATRLEGVDLSGGMLARARARGLYDALHQAELGAFLAARAASWDAIVAADVLNYFGDLGPVLQAAGAALRPGGLLVATVEALDDDGADHRLAIHGRYAHSERYLREALAAAGLQVLSVEPEDLRRELADTVRGLLFVAGRPAAA